MLQTLLLALLSCIWLSASSLANTSTTDYANYRLRRRDNGLFLESFREQQQRELNNQLLPSFSADDEALVEANMPDVTLRLKGLNGDPLGDKSYDALQTAMNDYLRKAFEDFFEPNYEFRDVETQVIGDKPFDEGFDEGNAVTLETRLTFKDPNYVPSEDEFDLGQRQRIQDRPTFRASDLMATEPPKPRMASPEAVPSEMELQLAAGHVWNDLTSFRNHLLVAAAIENLSTFNGMQEIDATETWPTNTQEVEIEAGNQEKEEGTKNDTPARPSAQDPSRGSTLNVAAASSALKESGTDRLNPLWPSLIIGIAVFLFTIIVLGYRKHKARQRDNPYYFKRGYGFQKHEDNVMIHVINDTSTLEGDEEIEVEDTFYSSPPASPNRKKDRKKQERDLDKEYAASCLKPSALGLSSSPSPPSTHLSSDEDDEEELQERRSKTCFPKISRRRSKRSLGEQDSMANYNYSRPGGIRRVDLTAEHDQADWRNPAELHQEGTLDNGDMTKNERKRFTKYIESGLTIEEASAQIMIERNAKENNSSRFRTTTGGLKPPSAMTHTRTGDLGGYAGHRGSPPKADESKVQSSPMGCFDTSAVAPCGDDPNAHTEIMEDGTTVQYTSSNNNNYMSLGDACSANDPNLLNGIETNRSIEGTARAMVITEASSYASSYDDDEFDRAMAEAEAETAFI